MPVSSAGDVSTQAHAILLGLNGSDVEFNINTGLSGKSKVVAINGNWTSTGFSAYVTFDETFKLVLFKRGVGLVKNQSITIGVSTFTINADGIITSGRVPNSLPGKWFSYNNSGTDAYCLFAIEQISKSWLSQTSTTSGTYYYIWNNTTTEQEIEVNVPLFKISNTNTNNVYGVTTEVVAIANAQGGPQPKLFDPVLVVNNVNAIVTASSSTDNGGFSVTTVLYVDDVLQPSATYTFTDSNIQHKFTAITSGANFEDSNPITRYYAHYVPVSGEFDFQFFDWSQIGSNNYHCLYMKWDGLATDPYIIYNGVTYASATAASRYIIIPVPTNEKFTLIVGNYHQLYHQDNKTLEAHTVSSMSSEPQFINESRSWSLCNFNFTGSVKFYDEGALVYTDSYDNEPLTFKYHTGFTYDQVVIEGFALNQ